MSDWRCAAAKIERERRGGSGHEGNSAASAMSCLARGCRRSKRGSRLPEEPTALTERPSIRRRPEPPQQAPLEGSWGVSDPLLFASQPLRGCSRGSLTPRRPCLPRDRGRTFAGGRIGGRSRPACKVRPRSCVQVKRRRSQAAHRRDRTSVAVVSPPWPASCLPALAPQPPERFRITRPSGASRSSRAIRTITASMVGSLSFPSRRLADAQPAPRARLRP